MEKETRYYVEKQSVFNQLHGLEACPCGQKIWKYFFFRRSSQPDEELPFWSQNPLMVLQGFRCLMFTLSAGKTFELLVFSS